jgi:hypothetical protein
MDAFTALASVLLGVLLGALGQGARVVVGIKKQYDTASNPAINKSFDEWFDVKLLVISLFIGGIAGGLASVLIIGKDMNVELLLGLIAAGYAGTDFIEGFMKTKTPQIVNIEPKTRDDISQQTEAINQEYEDHRKTQDELKQKITIWPIEDHDRASFARMDAEANQIMDRMWIRRRRRVEWITKNISVSRTEAQKQLIIDGVSDEQDVQRLYKLNKDRAAIIEKYAKYF